MLRATESAGQAAGRASTAPADDPAWAWAPYAPDDKRPWNLAGAGHLLRRAGFGAGWPEIQQALSDGPQRAVDKLLHPAADVDRFNQACNRDEAASTESGATDGLRAWWLRRMLLTPHPLLEKMTLFWHGHFATGNLGVGSAGLLSAHVGMLRRNALGRFDQMLQAVCQDPAVMLWLDAPAQRKALPAEHFARAVMECFTLGPGQFSEADVKESARAFTGWLVMMKTIRYIPREHDEGVKRVLGREGNFSGEDVVRVLLEHPATPRFVVRKVYRWLVSETDEPGDALLAPLAEQFAKDYDAGKLVERILRSNRFFSAAAYRQRIKNPVEFALGIVKGLEGTVGTVALGAGLARLGQDLYNPPTVKGWAGGRSWINAGLLVGRSNLAAAMLSGTEPYDKLDPAATAAKYGRTQPEAAARLLIDVFFQGDLPEAVREQLLQSARPLAAGSVSPGLRQLTHALVTLPEFHLA